MIRKHYFLRFVLLFTAITGPAYDVFSQSIGNGSEGSPSISGIVNAYTPLLQSAFPCNQKIIVGDATLFGANDLILIIQMQGAQIDASNTSSYGAIINYAGAGNYEYSKVKSIIGNTTLELQYPLVRSYDTYGKVQVIRVPQYVNPIISSTLTCQPWNGSTGGVLAIDATGSIDLQSGIDVSTTGFRGGMIISGTDFITDTSFVSETPSLIANAPKGEGIAFYGIAPFTSAKGAPANGGGGGNSHTAGGAGGSNFGCGGNGGWGYPLNTYYKLSQGLGGYGLSYSPIENKIFMGGGGGSGSIHDNNGTGGANGGGIIIITGNQMTTNSNSIDASGASSLNGGSPTHSDGIGGAGAGGTVLLSLNSISDIATVNISGGNGGNPSLLGAGPGGGGGGGMCWLSSPALSGSVSYNAAGGLPGSAQGNNYGATSGCVGIMLSNLLISINTTQPPLLANFSSLQLNALGTETSFANNSSNAVSYLWNFGDGITDTILNPTHTYSSPGIYIVTLQSTDIMNCKNTSSQVIITNIENVFTPNGDGKNDFFSFPNAAPNYYSLHFFIYDRWGKKMFDGNNENNKWDGTFNEKKVSEGTYYYVIEIINKENSEKIAKKGFLTLIR